MASNVTFTIIINALEGRERDLNAVMQRINQRIDALERDLCQFCPNAERLLTEVEVLSAALLLVDMSRDPAVANSNVYRANVRETVHNIQTYLAGAGR